MKELKRVLSGPRLLLALALILLANGYLFVREQRERDFGLDLSLPQVGFVIFDGTFTPDEEPPDAWAAYGRYVQWLDRMRGRTPEEAGALLAEEKESLEARFNGNSETEEDKLNYAAVNSLLARTGYLTGYGDWLDGVQANKENLLTFSIFNDPASFSGRNIFKTADEFEKLRGVELTLGADGAVEAVMSFRLTDYFLVAALLLTALSFLEERKTGLWSVVHAAPGGRLRLAARRTAILLAASAAFVLALYGTDLALGFALYGGAGDLGRAAQSVEILGRLPVLCTVGGFLARFLLLRVASAFLVALVLWLMLSAVNNVKYTIIVAAAVIAAEYGFYTYLPVQSAFNILKYFNLFTYISLSDLYTNYLNINVLGFPLGIRSISQLALAPLCLAFGTACVLVQCRKKPAAGRDLLGRAAYGINSVTDRGLRRLGPFGMELHKTLWIQKGVVVAALFIYVAAGLDYSVNIPVFSMEQRAAGDLTRELAGEITDGTFARMDELQAELEEKLAARDKARLDYENGLIDFPRLDAFEREASAAEINLKGLTSVRARAEELRDKGEQEGFTPWLVDETPFESVYGDAASFNQHRAAVTAVLALTLLMAGSMAYERQSGMTFLLRSTPRGRSAFLHRKLLLAGLLAALVWAVVYGMELYAFLSVFDVSAWRAPVQNLSMQAAFSVPCSIAGWLVTLYVYRWLCLMGAAVVVLLISDLIKRLEAAYIAASVVMLLPSLLYAYMGVEVFRPLAVILPVEAVPLLLRSGGVITGALLSLAALLTLDALSITVLATRRIRE